MFKSLAYATAALFSGCAVVHSEWRTQVIIDTTPESARAWLATHGYKDVFITGRRTEDCDRADLVGYGVIVKKGNKAASGIVCQSYDGEMRLRFDS